MTNVKQIIDGHNKNKLSSNYVTTKKDGATAEEQTNTRCRINA